MNGWPFFFYVCHNLDHVTLLLPTKCFNSILPHTSASDKTWHTKSRHQVRPTSPSRSTDDIFRLSVSLIVKLQAWACWFYFSGQNKHLTQPQSSVCFAACEAQFLCPVWSLCVSQGGHFFECVLWYFLIYLLDCSEEMPETLCTLGFSYNTFLCPCRRISFSCILTCKYWNMTPAVFVIVH